MLLKNTFEHLLLLLMSAKTHRSYCYHISDLLALYVNQILLSEELDVSYWQNAVVACKLQTWQ